MKCNYCKLDCIKWGKQQDGSQRYYCKSCSKSQQKSYQYKAYKTGINEKVIKYVKESVGIRSISRILKISSTTVIKKIKAIGSKIEKPIIVKGKEYEMDEMRTYIKSKENRYWIAYALRRDTREVVDVKVGKRNKRTLRRVVETLLMSEAKKIYTDRLNLYEYIIPKELHKRSKYKINYIERKNLSVRTHLKRLGRRTICFSRSLVMLEACLRIYFWGKTCVTVPRCPKSSLT